MSIAGIVKIVCLTLSCHRILALAVPSAWIWALSLSSSSSFHTSILSGKIIRTTPPKLQVSLLCQAHKSLYSFCGTYHFLSHHIMFLFYVYCLFPPLEYKLHACICAWSLQSCPTLCNSMDCNPLGSSVPGILQARILEWVAISSSKGSSMTQ